MNSEQKPHGTNSGQPETPMQRMKDVWKRLSDDARDYWREQLFSSHRKLSECRAEILAKFKIRFNHDARLSDFKSWIEDQDRRLAEQARMQEDERQITEEFGKDWTLDRIREEVLRRSYARAIATGNFADGRKTIVQDLNVQKVALDERKVTLLEKKAAMADATDKVLTNAELSPEERAQRIKEIYGRT